jgi:hypothetical protein
VAHAAFVVSRKFSRFGRAVDRDNAVQARANGVIGPGLDATLRDGDPLMAADVGVPAAIGLLLDGEQLDILAQRGRE